MCGSIEVFKAFKLYFSPVLATAMKPRRCYEMTKITNSNQSHMIINLFFSYLLNSLRLTGSRSPGIYILNPLDPKDALYKIHEALEL
jgi:hypothetical protein